MFLKSAGNDYHNELYGYLESTPEGKQRLNGLPRTRKRYNAKFKKDEEVSLSTYIRHSIHHPENGKNPPYTEEQLRESIETMRRLVQELKGGTGANRGNNPSQKKSWNLFAGNSTALSATLSDLRVGGFGGDQTRIVVDE